MDHRDISALMAGLAPVIRDYNAKEVSKAVERVDDTLKQFGERVATLEQREPSAGAPGPAGEPGKSVEPSEVRLMVAEEVAKIPPPNDGKSVTIDDVKPLLEDMVAALPKPADGKSVEPSEVRLMVAEEVAKIPPPNDGKSVTVEDVKPLLEDMVAALPKPVDGKDGAPGAPGELALAPDDIAEQVAKAISLVAESPRLSDKSSGPSVVLNVTAPQPNPVKTTNKTITTRKDEHGNLVADVIEQEIH